MADIERRALGGTGAAAGGRDGGTPPDGEDALDQVDEAEEAAADAQPRGKSLEAVTVPWERDSNGAPSRPVDGPRPAAAIVAARAIWAGATTETAATVSRTADSPQR